MAVFLSPGVFPNEIDLSILPRESGPTRPAFIGTATKGPMNEPTLVTTAEDFIDKFGEPTSDSYLGYAVLAYMEQGNQAFILRVGVEAALGQVADLADIAIDTAGTKEDGWGRIPVFTGIDFGRIALREVSAEAPLTFHDAAVSDINYNDIDVDATDGPTTATLSFSVTDYTGSIDDSYIMLITGAPDLSGGELLDGAEFEIIRNSDGTVVASGSLVESGVPGTSEDIVVGDGTTFAVVVSGTSPLEVDDTFTWAVQPDNRDFTVAVAGDTSPVEHTMPVATHTTAAAFIAAANALLGGADDYEFQVNGDGLPEIVTDTAGDRIQLEGDEAFALEVGVTQWVYDIPRASVEGQDEGTYVITTANDRVKVSIVGAEETKEITVSIPNSLTSTPDVVSGRLYIAGGIDSGERYFESFALQVTDDDKHVVIQTSDDHLTDSLKLKADFSNIETLRFADELDINFPYSGAYRVFNDTRLVMPDPGVVDPATPESCEDDPGSAQCTADSSYFENIVGFLVAASPGTWINGYTATLQNYNQEAGKFELILTSPAGTVVERIQDISFDPNATRYIANILNPGSTIGGVNGNSWVHWVERPTALDNDPINDPDNLVIRNPGEFFTRAVSGGQNGIPDAAFSSELDAAIIGNPALSTGIYAFQNPEAYDINLLSIPGTLLVQ